jgi:acyl-CoA synthetase (AMP-forming)/AMP-acid ligase II
MSMTALAQQPTPRRAGRHRPAQYSSLVALMEESFRSTPDRVAYSFMGKDVTYGQTDSLSRAFGGLPAGPGPGQGRPRGIMMPNVPQYPVVVAAILRAGLVVVNVNPLYTPRELEHQLKDSGAKAIVIIENFAGTLEQCIAATRPSSMWCCAPWATSWACSRARWSTTWCATSRRWCRPTTCRGAVRFNDAMAQGTRGTSSARHQARRRGRAAVHRRHHRREQGRGAAAPQRDRQRAAVRGLERAGDEQGARRASSPPACARCRCTTSSPSRWA